MSEEGRGMSEAEECQRKAEECQKKAEECQRKAEECQSKAEDFCVRWSEGDLEVPSDHLRATPSHPSHPNDGSNNLHALAPTAARAAAPPPPPVVGRPDCSRAHLRHSSQQRSLLSTFDQHSQT
eukprot:SAG11_NODE_1668_length_4494_cov_1.724460_5_plen_124_part_00